MSVGLPGAIDGIVVRQLNSDVRSSGGTRRDPEFHESLVAAEAATDYTGVENKAVGNPTWG